MSCTPTRTARPGAAGVRRAENHTERRDGTSGGLLFLHNQVKSCQISETKKLPLSLTEVVWGRGGGR